MIPLVLQDNQNKETSKNNIIMIGFLILLTSLIILCPNKAFAAEKSALPFSNLVANLSDIVNLILLPIAIVAVGWKIIYLALFCGLMGTDPLNEVPDGYSLQWSAVWTLIRARLSNFARGLAWVGGIWILFNVIIAIVSMLAGSLDKIL